MSAPPAPSGRQPRPVAPISTTQRRLYFYQVVIFLRPAQRAGVEMRPYDVRHIAATEMLARGADLAAVAAQLGHSSVATTGGIYAHVTANGQTHAALLMPNIEENDP